MDDFPGGGPLSGINNLDNVDYDERWIGAHGIGRFAQELNKRIQFGGYLNLPGSPTSPFDVVLLTLKMVLSRRIVFSPGYNAPFFGLRRYVLTVHDLNHIEFQGSGCLKKLYYKIVLKRACRQSAKVLTVSEYSRRRIIEWAGLNEEQVVTVGNGVGEDFVPTGTVYKPGFHYFLMVSNRKPHKNEERILIAFAKASLPNSMKVLITGKANKVILDLLSKYNLEGRVNFVGSCSDEELASMYRGAIGLVFASLYEGFGLPAIEAMACGTPVITSNVCALPEVAGNSALMVDPTDTDDIRAAMELLVSGGEQLRQSLAARGLRQANRYSWNTVSERVETVLRSLSLPV